MERPSIIERAFQIAKSGKASSVSEVKTILAVEGYDGITMYLQGGGLRMQLAKLVREAQAQRQTTPSAL